MDARLRMNEPVGWLVGWLASEFFKVQNEEENRKIL